MTQDGLHAPDPPTPDHPPVSDRPDQDRASAPNLPETTDHPPAHDRFADQDRASAPDLPPTPDHPPAQVKCVVWDIDNTLLAGVYLESGQTPPPVQPAVVAVLAELGRRGILHAIASRNPPAAAEHAAKATGWDFAAVVCGWGAKSDALRRVAADLGIGTDTLAFVDDDPFERAEVAAALPEVTVLSPDEVAQATAWPQFSPAVLTDEAHRRSALYAARRRRQEAEQSFGGSREAFLRWVGTQITIRAATPADVPRLDELAARTRQFNSAARAVAPGEFAELVEAEGTDVVTVALRDEFSDDGTVGGCVVTRHADTVTTELVMVSCRAMGRGVIDALLAWLARTAARQGAVQLDLPCVLTERNVPLRMALAKAGFEALAEEQATAGRPVIYRLGLTGALPDLPEWMSTPANDATAHLGATGEHGMATVPPEATPTQGQPRSAGDNHQRFSFWPPGGPKTEPLTECADVAREIREFLAVVTGREELREIADDTPLFGDGVALDSLTGTLLLREVQQRFGVDVAGEDLDLGCLASLGTLAAFVAERATW
ncbi:MAG TPA: phosphopantetheine-binding protein [Streptosporangiaceae bacterium]|nr:phosphopantetheine-binding protein [Streptosporangiaceae bacterium]